MHVECEVGEGLESIQEDCWIFIPHLARTNERLIAGEVFRVSETFEGSDGTLYLKLADGRGWVFESKAGIGTLCVRCQSDSDACLHMARDPGVGSVCYNPAA